MASGPASTKATSFNPNNRDLRVDHQLKIAEWSSIEWSMWNWLENMHRMIVTEQVRCRANSLQRWSVVSYTKQRICDRYQNQHASSYASQMWRSAIFFVIIYFLFCVFFLIINILSPKHASFVHLCYGWFELSASNKIYFFSFFAMKTLVWTLLYWNVSISGGNFNIYTLTCALTCIYMLNICKVIWFVEIDNFRRKFSF